MLINAIFIGGRKDIEWIKKRMISSPLIRILNISEIIPIEGEEGMFRIRIRLKRINIKKKRKFRLKQEDYRLLRRYATGRD